MDPVNITEDMPESDQDLKKRKLILDSGEIKPTGDQEYLTEALPVTTKYH